MKKIKLIYILGLLLFTIAADAQVPQAFYFQAFAAGEMGQPLANQAIGVQLKIIQNGPTGDIVYIETHAVSTNPVGAIDLMVGLGTTTDNFEAIDWAEGPYFMEISMDKTGGSNYELMGISQFLSVPYALVALNLQGAQGAQGAWGPAGPAGVTGAPGPDGDPGPDGPNSCCPCGGTSVFEGAQGPQGPAGANGLPGIDTDGISCWDLNGNNQGDTNEDTNNDGLFSVADCNLPGLPGPTGSTGNTGPTGEQGPMGSQGPQGPAGFWGAAAAQGEPGDPVFAKWEVESSQIYKTDGFVGIGNTNPSCKLDVSGNVCANGVVLTSDKRFKKNIQTLEPVAPQLSSIRGVSYDFKQNEFPQKEFSNESQIGLIAQEVEVVYPELVKTDKEGYKSVNYDQLMPILVQALQELVIERESMNERRVEHIQNLNAKVELLSSLLTKQAAITAEEE